MAVLAVRPRPVSKGEGGTKVFAFRCKWVEIERGVERLDGYSYAVTRDALDHMVAIRRRQNEPGCYSMASETKVVPIDLQFYTQITKQPNGCFTTTQDKHSQDYEVDHK